MVTGRECDDAAHCPYGRQQGETTGKGGSCQSKPPRHDTHQQLRLAKLPRYLCFRLLRFDNSLKKVGWWWVRGRGGEGKGGLCVGGCVCRWTYALCGWVSFVRRSILSIIHPSIHIHNVSYSPIAPPHPHPNQTK